jgi:hypothetical protein
MGLDREQLTWYAKKYDEYLDKRLICQEYPCSPDEAFLSTGDCIFDLEKLNTRMLQLATKPIPRLGEFVYDRIEEPIKGKDGVILGHRLLLSNIRFIERRGGMIALHEEPMTKKNEQGEITHQCPYVLGGDTAGEGSDFYTAKLLNNMSGATAATLRVQRMDEDLYAEQCFCLGKYYHDALIGIETNYSRQPTRHLQLLEYPNMYLRERMTGRADEVENVPGFETTTVTRRIIIEELVTRMRENPELEHDIETLRECTTFVRHPGGKKAAAVGAHDDLVMALAIANHIRHKQSYTWIEVKTETQSFIEKHFGMPEKKKNTKMEW